MMSILIYDKYLKLTESLAGPFPALSLANAVGKEDALFPEILAVTAGVSKNFNSYSSESLKGGKKNDHGERSGYRSFTDVYPKPLLLNHETFGDILGRIVTSNFVDNTHIMVCARISDWKYIEKVKEGDYLSVSVGYLTDSVVCSICGNDIYKTREICDHTKGQRYGKKLCVWEVGNMWFRELSFVSIPGVPAAGVISLGKDTSKKNESDETTGEEEGNDE